MSGLRRAKYFFGVSGLVLTGFLCGPSEARAQEAPGASESDEIVVTARRREERVQDVPASITAITSEDLRLRGGLEDSQALANTVVGLDFFNQDSRPANQQLIIRGAGTGSFVNTESGTGLYFNGIYSAAGSFSGFGPSDFLDLERVEVLRGPQGGLYGRNSLGGSINLISVRPQDTFSGELELGAGSKELETARAILNLPIADGWAARAVVNLTSQDDGFFENVATGRAFDRSREDLYRVSLLGEVTEHSELYIQFDSSSLANAGDNSVQTGFNAATGAYVPANDERLTGRSQDDDERMRQSTDNLFVSFVHDFDLATLTVLGQHRDRSTSVSFDIDGRAGTVTCPGFFLDSQFTGLEVIPFVSGETSTRCFGVFAEDTVLNTGEARLDGQLDVGSSTVSWLVGLDFRTVESDLVLGTEGFTGRILTADIPGRVAFLAPLLFPGNAAAQAAFIASYAGAVSTGTPSRNNLFRTAQDDQSWATYFSIDVADLFPNFTLSADVRYTQDDRELTDTVAFITGPACVGSNLGGCATTDAGVSIPALGPASLDQSFDNITWALAGRYDWSDDFNTYFRVGTAFRAGGGNPRSISSTEEVRAYDEETSISYEVGAKGRTSFGDGGQLDSSIAMFFTETEDVIANLRETPIGANGAPTIIRNLTNLGDQEVYGIEFETRGSFEMFGGSVNPSLGLTWSEGEITESTLVLANTNGQTLAEGTEVSRLPEYRLTANLSYERALFASSGQDVIGSFNVAYNQQWGGKEAPDNVLDLVEFENVDLRAALNWGGWEVAGEVRNATDEDAPVFQNGSLAIGGQPVVTSIAPRLPRTWLLSVTRRFGE